MVKVDAKLVVNLTGNEPNILQLQYVYQLKLHVNLVFEGVTQILNKNALSEIHQKNVLIRTHC